MDGLARNRTEQAAPGLGKKTLNLGQKGFYKHLGNGQNNQPVEEATKSEVGRTIKRSQPRRGHII